MKQENDINQLLALTSEDLSIQEQEDVRRRLAEHINFLILNDFHTLIQILYRVDVSEHKLKQLLRSSPKTDAAELITNLLLERQAEKKRMKAYISSKQNHQFIDPDLEW